MSTFLRRTLIIDAVISGTTGFVMLIAAQPLATLLGVPAQLLQSAGVSLVPFTAFLIWICMQRDVPRKSVWTVIALNIAWVIGSIALLFVEHLDLNRVGIAFILVQAAAVLVFAEMQYTGLRRGATA